ncbi:MAG: hypothetical protein GX053_15025 [Tissierella sp.]|nr:hypothetical protein [Tissierella sp.]
MIDASWIKNISFSDVDVLKVLIKYRADLDPYIYIEDRMYDVEKLDIADDAKPFNQDIINLFLDLDILIEKTNLTKKQREIIHFYEQGLNSEDIARYYNQDQREIEYILDTICKEIKNKNDELWKYYYVYSNYKKVKWNYKKCTKCGKSKPAVEEFFSPDKRNNDGLYSICRECR